MSPSRVLLFAVIAAFMAACTNNITTPVDQQPTLDETADTTLPDEDTVVLAAPGQFCQCDGDCLSTVDAPAVCLFGLCTVRAPGPCDTVDDCPAGTTCRMMSFNGEYGFCLYPFSDATCAGSPDREEFCVPSFGSACDPACGSWCKPFACGDSGGRPSIAGDSPETAKEISPTLGAVTGLTRCAGEDHWYKLTLPADTIVSIGIAHRLMAGNLDLVVYDEAGGIVAFRGFDLTPYPPTVTCCESDEEAVGLYSRDGGAVRYIRVTGANDAANEYDLTVVSHSYKDGKNCIAAGFTDEQCRKELIPFPAGDMTYPEGQYLFDCSSNYRFSTRAVTMAVRYALGRTMAAFPDTTPLGLNDMSQNNGWTPAYDMGGLETLRHREEDHRNGTAIDIAFFQTGPDNRFRAVCEFNAWTGVCIENSEQPVTLDAERQAFFMVRLLETGAVDGVMLVDEMLIPLIDEAAEMLSQLPEDDPRYISPAERANLAEYTSWLGWHFHHLHFGINIF